MDEDDAKILLNTKGISAPAITGCAYPELAEYAKIKKSNFVKKRLEKWKKEGIVESQEIERKGRKVALYGLKKGSKVMGLTGSGLKGFAYATDKKLHIESFEGNSPEFKKFFNTIFSKHQKG